MQLRQIDLEPEALFSCLAVSMAVIGAMALFVSFAATPAEAGIFRPGQRYIFNWRRPSIDDSGPDQDNPRPIISDRLSQPATTAGDAALAAVVAENKKLKADAAEPVQAAAEPTAVAAASAESRIPDWSLLAALGAGLGIPVIRRAASWVT